MKPFVLDASVALGWTLDNPVPASATRAKQALLSGTRAVAPALWHLEIANGLAVAERRGILTSSDAMLALLQLEQLCAQALEIEADIVPMRQALTTARAYRLGLRFGLFRLGASSQTASGNPGCGSPQGRG
jgi:hypothetical protein